jgi:putative tryptophan/tyrosine transport system substrate-binding protein
MRRREFFALLGGAAVAWPPAVLAQQSDRVPRIGVLIGSAGSNIKMLVQRLEELGWIDGRNIRIDYRYPASDPNHIKAAAAELVDLNPDVIVTITAPETMSVQEQTRTVPVVFVMVADPVGSGIVESLARPGGNATGFTNFEASMGGKWLELLKEMVPSLANVAVFMPPTERTMVDLRRAIEAAAHVFEVELTVVPNGNSTEINRAIDAFVDKPNGGLVVFPSIYVTASRDLILALAARYGLPAIYPFGEWVRFFGGLMSYGINVQNQYVRAAVYVDRVLRGAKPADLPVQAPDKFELLINLWAAKTVGLTVPPSLLARADEVIE